MNFRFPLPLLRAAGDAIDFLELVRGLTYGQALAALEKIYYADDAA